MSRMNRAMAASALVCALFLACGCGSESLDNRLDAYAGAPAQDCGGESLHSIAEERA